jgi:hypothetical protein
MNRRRLLTWFVVSCALLVVAVFVYYYTLSQLDPGLVYDKLERGQTVSQALSQVPLRPGDYRTTSSVAYFAVGPQRTVRGNHPGCHAVYWEFDRGLVVAYVNRDGDVVAKQMYSGVQTRRMPWHYLADTLRALDRVAVDGLR